jgi:hypothetical protein
MSAGVGIGLVAALFLLWPRPFGMDPALVPYAFGYVVVQLITLRSTPRASCACATGSAWPRWPTASSRSGG